MNQASRSSAVRFPRSRFALAVRSALAAGLGLAAGGPAWAAPGDAATPVLSVAVQTAGQFLAFPAIAVDADGDFVILWHDTGPTIPCGTNGTLACNVYGRRYFAGGRPRDSQFPIPLGSEVFTGANSPGRDFHPQPRVDALGNDRFFGFPVSRTLVSPFELANAPDGRSVLVFEGGNAGSRFLSQGRLNPDGSAVSQPLRVNSTTRTAEQPSVAMDASGDYVIVWTNTAGQDGTGSGVFGRRYGADGVAQGEEFRVNTQTSLQEFEPSVAMDAAGNFVVVWVRTQLNFTNGSIRAQRYAADGTPLGTEFGVNTGSNLLIDNPGVAMDALGRFVVVWTQNVSGGVIARYFGADGTPLTGDVPVSLPAGVNKQEVDVAMDADGDAVVTWVGQYNDAEGNPRERGVYARLLAGPDAVDLRLSGSATPQTVEDDAPHSYSFSIENLRSASAPTGEPLLDQAIGRASGLRLNLNLAPGARLTGTSTPGWQCAENAGVAMCDTQDPLLPSAATELVIDTRSPFEPGGTFSATGTAASRSGDDNPGDNSLTLDSTLIDNCAEGSVRFSAGVFGAVENAGPRSIPVIREGGSCGAVTVNFSSSDLSALAGLDYTGVAGSLSWADGASGIRRFEVPVLDDALSETRLESLALALEAGSGAPLGGIANAQLNIVDNESPGVSLEALPAGTENLLEGGARLVFVNFARTTTAPVDLGFSLSGSAAINDFRAEPAAGTTITIPAGTRRARLTRIVARNDSLDESDETLTLTLDAYSAGSIDPARASLTLNLIDDDPAPQVFFNSSLTAINEASSRAISLALNAVHVRDVSVPVTVSGTAVLDTDYTLSPSTVIIPAGQLSASILISVTDDDGAEDLETIGLQLGTPTNATLGSPATLDLSIPANVDGGGYGG